MKVLFDKYHGNGNDFIIVDGINNSFNHINSEKIKSLCHRNTGIGSDGFIIIKSNDQCDYEMVYYNSNGNVGSFCGNGARCAAHFVLRNKILKKISKFKAFDGYHLVSVQGVRISISINQVDSYKKIRDDFFIDTGSPHLIKFNQNLEKLNIEDEFKRAQESKLTEGGVNVNFVSKKDKNTYHARTYERGVNAETLSCGTGAVAIALCSKLNYNHNEPITHVITKGGKLSVTFNYNENKFFDIFLLGNAEFVYTGNFNL
tara:strand:+ start:4030 stop:4806 length:777 start_codon:yes stop_codon:yes gene_type:complete